MTASPSLFRIVDAVAADSPPLRLRTGLLGAFPSPTRPRVLWLGLEGDTQLLAVTQLRLQDALEADAFPREQRAFKPHISLSAAPEAMGSSPSPRPSSTIRQKTLWPSKSGISYSCLAYSPPAARSTLHSTRPFYRRNAKSPDRERHPAPVREVDDGIGECKIGAVG